MLTPESSDNEGQQLEWKRDAETIDDRRRVYAALQMKYDAWSESQRQAGIRIRNEMHYGSSPASAQGSQETMDHTTEAV